MKVRVLERYQDKYLVKRYYRKLDLIEYVVCEKYNFRSNIYVSGIIIYSLPVAYKVFNIFVNTGVLSVKDECDESD